MLLELGGVGVLETGEDAAVVHALAAVVERGDVPAGAQDVEEAHEGTGVLRELEGEDPLVDR